MVLNTGSKRLSCIQEVWNSETNAAYVCETMDGSIKAYYTVLMVKDRAVARAMLKTSEYECFSHQGNFCFLFPYYEPRTITRYYMSVVERKPEIREKIWKDLVVSCMTSGIAWPLLHQILKQEQVYLFRDGSVSLGYLLHLKDFNEYATEAQCVSCLAEILLRLLEQEPGLTDLGQQLLKAKLDKKCYSGFLELFRDIQMITRKVEKESLKKKLCREAGRHKDKAYRFLVALSVILAVLVLIMLLMQLFFGEVTFFDIFRQSMKVIGTESLLQ